MISNEQVQYKARGFIQDNKATRKVAHGYDTQNLLDVTPHAGRKPYHTYFDWGVYLPFVAQTLRIKRYNYPQVSNYVRSDPILQHAIKQAAEQMLREQKIQKYKNGEYTQMLTEISNAKEMDNSTLNNLLSQQRQRATTILNNMRSTLNNFLLAFTSWILYKLLPCFLSGVVTHRRQIEMLKSAVERSPGVPLIFLPLHRSHLDYIMVTFILANNDIRSPLVAAGNNLQIPIFGGLLRGLGAFFIKRKIDPVVGKKDILYRAILQLYLQHALKNGHNVEFFIEGGRTRTGKPCMPKGGILSVIVNAFMDRSIPDALIVPVSVNYERLVDGNFVCEQKGEKKVQETFGKAISAIWKALNSKYGLMRIDFNEPYSIKELVQSYNKLSKEDNKSKPSERMLKHNQSTSSLYGTDVVCEEHRNLIESISRQVVYDCATATSVMSTNALAFLLLTQYRQGALDTEIANGLDQLRCRLKGQRDLGFAGESVQIVNYAANLLGKELVLRTRTDSGDVLIRPIPTIDSTIELAYYSNMLTPHFALKSILLTTFHSLLPKPAVKKEANTVSPGVVRKTLIEKALANCEIYRYEYILCKPTQNLEDLLETTLDDLALLGFLKYSEIVEEITLDQEESKTKARHYAKFLDDDDDDQIFGNDNDYDNEKPDIFLSTENMKEQLYICEVLAPFAHTYYAVAQSLNILYKNSMLESEFIKFVIKDLTQKFHKQQCIYGESISTDSVRNCLKVLEKWSVIEISSEHGLRILTLGTLYDVSFESLKSIVQRISAIVPNYSNGYF